MGLRVNGQVLVSRRVDGWLVGWLGVAVWIGCQIGNSLGFSLPSSAVTTLFWGGAALTAAHFGLSYHLAYGYGATAARSRPIALIAIPALLASGLVTAAILIRSAGPDVERSAAGAGITAVYLLTAWHYVKQTYGVGRVAAHFGGVRLSQLEGNVLRFGLYPLWFLNAAQVLRLDRRQALDGYWFGAHLLPGAVIEPLRVVALTALVPIALVFVRIIRRGAVPWALVGTYLVAVLWFALPPSPLAIALALAPIHAVQYLAIGHRAELGLAIREGTATTWSWWTGIAMVVTAGGLLMTRWLPPFLDRSLDPQAPLLASAVFFVFLNLHHYLIDACIWRAKGPAIGALSTSEADRPTVAAPALV